MIKKQYKKAIINEMMEQLKNKYEFRDLKGVIFLFIYVW